MAPLKTNKLPALVKLFLGRKGYLEVQPICNLIFRLWLFACLAFTTSSSYLFAQEAFVFNYKDLKPAKIYSSASKTCGSALIHGQFLLTNAHVASSFCQNGYCSDLEISSINNETVNFKRSEVKINKIASSLDLALLQLPFSPDSFSNKELSFDSELTAISFPDCGLAQISKGQALENISNLYISTNLALKHGSSGAGVFEQNAQLFGIVTESEDVLGAIKSIVLGKKFDATRIIPQALVQRFLEDSKEQLFELQIQLLLNFYKDQVLSRSKLSRITESARFLNKAKTLALENIELTHSKFILAGFASTPYPFFTENHNSNSSALLLGLIISIEKNGLNKSLISELSLSELDQIKNNQSLYIQYTSSVIDQISSLNFKGIEIELFNLALKLVLSLISFFAIFIIVTYLFIFKIKRFTWPTKLILLTLEAVTIAASWLFVTKSLIL